MEMSQKKTVFERLEDQMIELQQNLDKKLGDLAESLENLKQEIPRSIGQNLMSFSDMIGGKIEDIEESVQNLGGSGGSSVDSSLLNTLKGDIDTIKSTLKDIQKNIQTQKPETPSSSTPAQISPSKPPSSPITPTITTPTTSKPAIVPPSTPVHAPAKITSQQTPSIPLSIEGPLAEVLGLLESIRIKAKSGLSGQDLGTEMEQIRDTIVKVFRWHPALYELATFSRRLKKFPIGQPPDTETLHLLFEKIDEWKNRVSS